MKSAQPTVLQRGDAWWKLLWDLKRNTRYLKKSRCWWNWHWSEAHAESNRGISPVAWRTAFRCDIFESEKGKATNEWYEPSEISTLLNTRGVCRVHLVAFVRKSACPGHSGPKLLPPRVPLARGRDQADVMSNWGEQDHSTQLYPTVAVYTWKTRVASPLTF